VLILLISSISLFYREITQDKVRSIKSCLVNTPFMLLIFIFVYFGLLFMAINLFGSSVVPNTRHTSCVFMASLILVLFLFRRLYYFTKRRVLRLTLIVSGTVFAGGYLAAGTVVAAYYHKHGRALSSDRWKNLRIADRLKSVPLEVPVLTAHPIIACAVVLYTGRPAYPISVISVSDPSWSTRFVEKIKKHGGILIRINPEFVKVSRLFRQTALDSADLSEPEIQRTLSLHNLSLRILDKSGGVSTYQIGFQHD